MTLLFVRHMVRGLDISGKIGNLVRVTVFQQHSKSNFFASDIILLSVALLIQYLHMPLNIVIIHGCICVHGDNHDVKDHTEGET